MDDDNDADNASRVPAEQAGIAAVVGIGKSSLTRGKLPSFIDTLGREKLPYRVLWLIPTHLLGKEALCHFVENGIRAATWKGREYIDPADPSGEAMCLDLEAAGAAITLGIDVEKHVCGDPKNGLVCVAHGICKYQRQKAAAANAEVVISAHQTLFGVIPKLLTKDVGLVVVDESWWQAGLQMRRETRLAGFADAITKFPPLRDANAIHSSDKSKRRDKDVPKYMVTDESATKKLFDWATKAETAFLATDVDDLVSKAVVFATDLTADNCREAILLEWRRQVEPNIWPGMPKKMRKDAMEQAIVNASLARRAGIWRALAELLDSDNTHTGRLQMGERTDALGPEPTILLHSRKDISRQLTDIPMLLLDASLPHDVVKYFLPRFELLARIDAAAPYMTVTQVVRGWGRSNLVPAHTSKVAPAETRRRENFLCEVRDFVALQTAATGRSSLVITYEAIEDRFADIPGVATGHFNALRGVDAHGKVGNLFVIGRPLPAFDELRCMAMALTGRPVPVEEPHKENRGLVMANGSSASIEVRAYADPTLEMLRAAITDAEVIDCIGRARAVNRTSAEDGVHVWLMADVATPLPITTLTNWDNLRLSPVARMAARGCALKASADAFAAYPDLFPTPNAAKLVINRDWERWVSSPYEKSTHKGTTLTSHLTPVRYQLPGPGKKPATAWFSPHLLPTARAWLEERLGPLVNYQPPAAQPQAADPAPPPRTMRPALTIKDLAKLNTRATIQARLMAQRHLPPNRADETAAFSPSDQQPLALASWHWPPGQRVMVPTDRITIHTAHGIITTRRFDGPVTQPEH